MLQQLGVTSGNVGVKGYTARSFLLEEKQQWPIVIKNQGTAFKEDGTIPMTIVVFRVFVVGVNGPIAGQCLR